MHLVHFDTWARKSGYFVQNFTNSSASFIHRSASAAASFQSYHCFIRENCSNLLTQFIAGRSTGPSKRLPMQHSGCPTFMRQSHYVANKFPLFISAVFCPGFHVTCSASIISGTCLFQICQISCHGSPQEIPPGAPTKHRSMRRKLISNLIISALWMQRGLAPKPAIGVTMASKNVNLFLMDIFRLRKIYLLTKKARLADCKC